MASARTMLVDAAQSFATRAEDRLTELVATAAKGCPPFAAKLLASLQLPLGDRLDIRTQVFVEGVGKPDLVIRAYQGSHWRSQLWFEHKLDARDQPRQRQRYLAALKTGDVPSELYYVVSDIERAREEGGWHGITWQQLGELANDAGCEGFGDGWRDRALDPDAPAQWRVLAELVWYLNDKGYAVLDALDQDKVTAIGLATRAARTLDALMEGAAEHTGLVPSGHGSDSSGTRYRHFENPRGHWVGRLGRLECGFDLSAAERAHWLEDASAEPCFAAGCVMLGVAYPVLAAREQWVAGLEAAGYSFSLWGGWACIYRTKPMAELVGAGASLPAQAEALGDWAGKAFRDLGAHDPGRVAVPRSPRRR